MKILFLTQRFPFPLDRGDRIRSYHILRYLAGRHNVSLASLTDEDIQDSHWKEIKDLCATVDIGRIQRNQRRILSLFYLPTSTPLTTPNYYSKELRSKVDLRIRKESFDLIFIYCSSMAQYVLRYSRIPKVIDFVDIDSEKWFEYARSTYFPTNLVYFREGVLLRRYEKIVTESCLHAFVTSHREKLITDQFRIGTPVTSIRNGVSMSEKADPMRSGSRMIFTGVMDYRPNEDAVCHFVKDIFPLICKEIPEAEFFIVGQKPTRRVKELSKVTSVNVTGWVPDTHEYMRDSAVFVAPIRIARGVQNKVLEAMAAGLPVVATSAAADGLEAVERRDYLLGDSPDRFAEQVVLLLRDSGLRKQLAHNAIEYVRRMHDWTSNLEEMENILLDVVEMNRGCG